MIALSRYLGMAGVAAAVLWLASACLPDNQQTGSGQNGPSLPTASSVGAGGLGCAAATCHGEVIPTAAKKGEDWRWAATVWRTQDNHSQAYRVLLWEQSKAIIKNLGEKKAAHENPRCLVCHSDPALAHVEPTPAIVDARAEGVGCAACHGPPDRWLTAHLTWDKKTDRFAEYQKHGMTWLNDLDVRAGVCVGCHVGAPAGSGITERRDVNHDLIAAGHPRLNFEFATYLRTMPPHWTEKNRKTWQPVPPGFATRAWSAGQYASLRAALDLLADRLPKSAAIDPVRPWPEFSEFNCYDCHHELAPSGRTVRQAGPKRGGFGWQRARTLDLCTRDQDRTRKANPAVTSFIRLMDKQRPVPAKLRPLLPRLRASLKAPPPLTAGQLLRRIRPGAEELSQMDWDDASWLYYALVAIELDRREVSGTAKVREELNQQFAALADSLRLDSAASPSHYDPARSRPLFLKVMNQLNRLFSRVLEIDPKTGKLD